VFLGALAGQRSPVPTYSPLVGAEVVLAAHARLSLPVEPGYEHGVLVDAGPVSMSDTRLQRAELGYLPPGAATVELANLTGDPARILLLGGAPFEEDIIMWWNFVGRTSEEITQAREDWKNGARFGEVHGYDGARLPAPTLPPTPLKPRGRMR
jgi:redox-sensitive bicupin YhaK (pirin superfamily)